MPQQRGARPKKIARIVRRISYENQILSERIIGVETPIPPIMINAAAPDGASRGGSTTDISE
jgi:hypothetical protein